MRRRRSACDCRRGSSRSSAVRCVIDCFPISAHPGERGRVIDRRSPRVTSRDGGVGIVFQAPILLDWRTGSATCSFPSRCRKAVGAYLPTARKLSPVGLADFGDRYLTSCRAAMRQRAAIARAPSTTLILIMDEPFGRSTPEPRSRCASTSKQLWLTTRKTSLITHSIDLLLADRVVVMSPRRRVERFIAIDSPGRAGSTAVAGVFIAISQRSRDLPGARRSDPADAGGAA